MAKPQNKEELLHASQQNFERLNTYIDSLSDEKKQTEFPEGTLNRNIRDVLAHLHEWHLMFLNWYEIGMTGEKPDMPAKGFKWKDLPALNKRIWEESQDLNLKTVRKNLNNSFSKVQKVISKHSDEELFEKKRYKWTGTTSLGVYLISNASSHYAWALKLCKKNVGR